MPRTCGFSKEKLLEIARNYAPEAVDVNIEEQEDFFVLILKWLHKRESRGIVAYKMRVEKEDEVLLERIREKTEEDLHQHIDEFLKSIINHIAEEPHFQELLEKKYEDTNVIYKVPK